VANAESTAMHGLWFSFIISAGNAQQLNDSIAR
jgi:hypothetical protein